MQTPQANKTIKQFTKKTIFFNFCEIWVVTTVEMLKTTVAQQAQYSHGFSYFHGTLRPSMSRQEESPTPAGSINHRQQRGQPDPEPLQATRFTAQPTTMVPKPAVQPPLQ